MKIAVIGKFPPIHGGVSCETYWTCRELASRGHDVDVFTNAEEVEFSNRHFFWGDDSVSITEGVKGHLRVHNTQPVSNTSYVPYANPFGSKLYGMAIEGIQRHRCEAIIGWYFEPYGLIASIVGKMLGLPVFVRHAGSDLGRLAQHADLRKSYQSMIANANLVITAARTKRIFDLLYGLGAKEEQVLSVGRAPLNTAYYGGPPLDTTRLQTQLVNWYTTAPLPESLMRELTRISELERDPSTPKLAIFGKVGPSKGTYDLLAAMKTLAAQACDFHLVAAIGGSQAELTQVYSFVLADKGLRARTTFLPLVAPWRVPQLLRASKIACILEREFPIAFHLPRTPREVLASGSCLVCSREIAAKYRLHPELEDGRNCVVIESPKDTHALTCRLQSLLERPDHAEAIGHEGELLSQAWELQFAKRASMADAVELAVEAASNL